MTKKQRKVTWRTLSAIYLPHELEFMRGLRGVMLEVVCRGQGPGPKNVLASDGVVYTARTWRWKKDAQDRRKRECFFIHAAKSLFDGRLR